MTTRRLPATPDGIATAAALLGAGRLVAFGTETVYGLGARADSGPAVAAIYAAKGRPSNNPLICHYPDTSSARQDVVFTPIAETLAAALWPGPLTLVLPRHVHGRIHPAAAGSLLTLAVRVPAHPVALALLRLAALPIAAPSANPSGRISPTTADHVLDHLTDRIDAVLDTGPCRLGLESTILDLSTSHPALLRPGAIPLATIEAVIGPLAAPLPGLRAPGQLAAHYAPSLPLRLNATHISSTEALLAYGPPLPHARLTHQLSLARSPQEAASRLYAALRQLDAGARALGLTGLAAMPIPLDGLGAALNDRLTRAATRA